MNFTGINFNEFFKIESLRSRGPEAYYSIVIRGFHKNGATVTYETIFPEGDLKTIIPQALSDSSIEEVHSVAVFYHKENENIMELQG